jgi:hypothetical protein
MAEVALPTNPQFTFGSFGADQAPALALDGSCTPHVLTATEWTKTLFSTFDLKAGWTTSMTPMPSYSGSLTYTPAGEAYALAHDGDFNTTLWKLSGAWLQVDSLPGQVGAQDQGFGVDPLGNLHAALWTSGSGIDVDTFDGAWTVGASTPSTFPPTLAVSATNASHVAYWQWLSSGTSSAGFSWWSPPGAPEIVAMTTLNPSQETTSIATSAADAANPAGTPHILFGLPRADFTNAVTYATRTGPSQWSTVTIAADGPPANPCPTPGGSCTVTAAVDLPIGIVATASGDVRMFYSTENVTYTCSAGSCSPSESSPGAEAAGSTLRIAWLEKGVPESLPLATVNNPSVATLAIDTAGNIHLAVFEVTISATTMSFATRYLQIGVAP